MAMKTHTIKSMFENICPIRSRLTEMLMVTDLSTFCYTFDIELTAKEKDYYLRPIRDLVDQEEWIKSEVVKGTTISIVGTDLPLWIMRIKEPTQYWGTFQGMGEKERKKSENIVRSIELEIAEIRHAIMNSSEDWNVDTDLYDDVCTTLIRSLKSYQERMTYTLRPSGKFMLLSSSSSLSEIETSFGSTLFEDSTYEWHLYSGTTHSSIDMLYARINIEWPAYAGPPSTYSRGEAVSWVPHSIVDANEDEIETWIISLSKNSTTINCTDGTESTASHRSANKRDLFISATFADVVGNSWDNVLPIEIGHK
ncbi:hypothetical protein LTR17_013234 [Elasticomyces elasticus]|nr:hypothetical protein LTR17_013234 [Elasticomyces elasticus]